MTYKNGETFNRIQLQRDYVESCIDGMDISDLAMIVADMLHEKLEVVSDEEFLEEVRDYQPHLLD